MIDAVTPITGKRVRGSNEDEFRWGVLVLYQDKPGVLSNYSNYSAIEPVFGKQSASARRLDHHTCTHLAAVSSGNAASQPRERFLPQPD